MDNAIEITRVETDTKVDLSRIYAAPGARLGCLAFEGPGAFCLPMLNADGAGYRSR